jgi:osmotically-inducible protein OsmY
MLASLVLMLQGASVAMAHGDPAHAQPGDDHYITDQIRTALYKNPSIASNDISVQTRNGVVYLRGLVDTNVERADIEALARGMDGVKQVVDSLELRNDVR